MNELIEQMGANFNIPKLTLLNSPNLQHVLSIQIHTVKRPQNFKSDFFLYRVREMARIYPMRKTKLNNTMKCLANLQAQKMVTEDKYESR